LVCVLPAIVSWDVDVTTIMDKLEDIRGKKPAESSNTSDTSGTSNTSNTLETSKPPEAPATPPSDPREYVDDLGEFNFGGNVFKVLSVASQEGTYTRFDLADVTWHADIRYHLDTKLFSEVPTTNVIEFGQTYRSTANRKINELLALVELIKERN